MTDTISNLCLCSAPKIFLVFTQYILDAIQSRTRIHTTIQQSEQQGFTTHRIQLINQIPGESAGHLVLNLIMEKILLQNGLVPKIASYGRIAATKEE